MSIIVRRPIDERLLLEHMIRKRDYAGNLTYVSAYKEQDSQRVSFPLCSALKHGFTPKLHKTAQRKAWDFKGTFRSPEQSAAFDAALKYLNDSHACILSLHVGFGKTFLALKLAAHIGLKTLIVVPTSKKVLQCQWHDEILRFMPDARVELLSSKSVLGDDCASDIFIASAHCVSKIWKKLTFIPFVIVDELHLVLSPKGFHCLLHLFPFFLLGLSATPYRLDGSNELVELFFGKAQVEKKLKRDYLVWVIQTAFKFKIHKTEKGKLNWGAILSEQANHEQRNRRIAQIVCENRGTKFLILCKCVDQIKILAQNCREGGVAVQAVYEDISPVKDERTLIGTVKKLGTGFSDSSFKGLIIAADVQDYFIQYFGRVLRDPADCPVIYDIVDDNHVMRKHFKARREIYVESGGKLEIIAETSLESTASSS